MAFATTLAVTRVAAPPTSSIAGGPRLHGGLHLRQSVRGVDVYASLHRSNSRPWATMVQYGSLRQSSKASCVSKACSEATKAKTLSLQQDLPGEVSGVSARAVC